MLAARRRPEYPCGLCGIRAAFGQQLVDAADIAGCPCWLEKTTTIKPKHDCKLVGAIDYSLGAASKNDTRVKQRLGPGQGSGLANLLSLSPGWETCDDQL